MMNREEKLTAIAAEGREVVDLENVDRDRRHAPRHGIMCYMLPEENTIRDAEEAKYIAKKQDYYDNHKYKDVRREAYGDIGAQLDMQYWDQVNGTTTFQDHVAAVKAAHPKPD